MEAAAEHLITAPVSTTDCEMGFSRQNLIKADVRNSLKPTIVQNLMRLSINSKREKMDFELASNKSSPTKARKILTVNYK